MLEIDTRDIDNFLEEKKKVYSELNDIFNALCWRMYRSEETYYNEKLDVYIIKSDGFNSNIFVSLVIKYDKISDIKKIICIMIENKETGKREISEVKNKI